MPRGPHPTTGPPASCTAPPAAVPAIPLGGIGGASGIGRGATPLYCYTPLLSLATFTIELSLALYVLVRYRPTAFLRLSFAFLACLALFQLSEFRLCAATSASYWLPLAFLAITPLPAIGQHMLARLTDRYWRLTVAIYAVAAAFELGFLLLPRARLMAACQPLYVGLTTGSPYWNAYSLYYLGALGLTLLLALHQSRRSLQLRRPLRWLMLAYASFLLPTLLLLAAHAVARTSIPSIMCAFALIAAALVVGRLLPNYGETRRLWLR